MTDPIHRAARWARAHRQRDALMVLAPFAYLWDFMEESDTSLDALIAAGRARDNMLVAYATLARKAFEALGGEREDFAPLVDRALDDDPEAVDALCGICGWLDDNLPAMLTANRGGRPPQSQRDRGIRILYEVALRERYPRNGWDNLPYGAKARLTADVAGSLAKMTADQPKDDRLRRILDDSLKADPDPVSSGHTLADTYAAWACILGADA